jgi:hypothetical protein
MKMLGILLAVVLSAGTAFGVVDTSFSPFRETVQNRIKVLESGTVSGEGTSSLRVARALYSVANDGGNSGRTYNLGVFLPQKSVIIRSFYRIDTAFAQTGTVQNTGTLAIACEDSGNILSATSSLSGVTAGNMRNANVSGPTPEAFVSGIANSCNISVTVAGANYTAGKLTLWVQYITQE